MQLSTAMPASLLRFVRSCFHGGDEAHTAHSAAAGCCGPTQLGGTPSSVRAHAGLRNGLLPAGRTCTSSRRRQAQAAGPCANCDSAVSVQQQGFSECSSGTEAAPGSPAGSAEPSQRLRRGEALSGLRFSHRTSLSRGSPASPATPSSAELSLPTAPDQQEEGLHHVQAKLTHLKSACRSDSRKASSGQLFLSISSVGAGLVASEPGSSQPTARESARSSAVSLPGLHVTTLKELALEVQDLQLLGKGGYGLVATGTWKHEGRAAVKVLLSDEDKWLDSCYKEASLSRALAHPNVLQTYDFQVAVLTAADHAAVQGSWHQQQLREGAARLGPTDLRADSFEMPTASGMANAGFMRCNSGSNLAAPKVDLYQILFSLNAQPGQFVTLIIMEYAEVGTLQRAISDGAFREGPKLSKWAALRSFIVTAKEVAGGMCLLHNSKIIHGDLTPGNIMLKASRIDKRGFVAKVGDFGLSKVTCSGVTRTDNWCTVAYLAPECIDYECRLESDVFSFGVCLWTMVTGKMPFGNYQPAQIIAGRLEGDLELEWPEDVHPRIRALADRCMATEPVNRPTFRQVVDELKRLEVEAKVAHRAHSVRSRASSSSLLDQATHRLMHQRQAISGCGAPSGRSSQPRERSALGPPPQRLAAISTSGVCLPGADGPLASAPAAELPLRSVDGQQLEQGLFQGGLLSQFSCADGSIQLTSSFSSHTAMSSFADVCIDAGNSSRRGCGVSAAASRPTARADGPGAIDLSWAVHQHSSTADTSEVDADSLPARAGTASGQAASPASPHLAPSALFSPVPPAVTCGAPLPARPRLWRLPSGMASSLSVEVDARQCAAQGQPARCQEPRGFDAELQQKQRPSAPKLGAGVPAAEELHPHNVAASRTVSLSTFLS